MSLSEVNNPKAAADFIKSFRRRFKTKVCMAPFDNHDKRIVSAHTLSVESMLRKIAVEGHVYAADTVKNMSKDTLPICIKRKGIRDVSVFNGFCSTHDMELFECLDSGPYRFSQKQNFMLAYRAISRECYLKRMTAESLPSPEKYAEIHGINEKLKFSDIALIQQAASLRGAEEAELLKSTLDSYLVSETWSRLITRVILFPKTPTVLTTAAFQPFIDMNGKKLQEYENLKAEMSQLSISVIPVETGGAVIFSWLDTANSAPRKFYESVLKGSNLTSSVLHLIFDNIENFALNPTWYESLSSIQKDYVFSRVILFDQITAYQNNKRPDNSAPYLDDWGESSFANF